mgnify:FL=1
METQNSAREFSSRSKEPRLSFSCWLKAEITDLKILLRNIPSFVVAIFILSVVCANLMANKELISYKYVALDCGFVFSWIMFLCMDVICKQIGRAHV